MALLLHARKLLGILGGQLVTQQVPVGGEVATHPARLDLEKHIRGHFQEIFLVKARVGRADFRQSGLERVRVPDRRHDRRLAGPEGAAAGLETRVHGRRLVAGPAGCGRPVGEAFVEEKTDYAEQQQRENPHAAAAGAEQAAEEHGAERATDQAAHQAATEAAGLRGLLLALVHLAGGLLLRRLAGGRAAEGTAAGAGAGIGGVDDRTEVNAGEGEQDE